MGDIEAPDSRPPPPQNALLSVLPSKEFASSKKGMLLLAEVAELDQSLKGSREKTARGFTRLQSVNQTRILLSVHYSTECQTDVYFSLEVSVSSELKKALSFISFVCFAASEAAAFVTVPLLEFLAALFLLFAYSTKFNERFKGFLWPLMDFMRCVTASVIFFIVSIMAVSKYVDGSSKAAGVFGFIATIVFALDFYLIFNELATFLKQGGETTEEPSRQQDEFSDSDSD